MLEINEEIIRLVDKAIEEDLVGGIDVTSVATIPEGMESVAKFVAKAEGVIAGIEIAELVMKRCGVAGFEALRSDGDSLKRGDLIATASGDTRSILLAERTALNFMTHLSGIATLTSRWVSAVAGTKAKIRDTRKTTPGLRTLEKYAVPETYIQQLNIGGRLVIPVGDQTDEQKMMRITKISNTQTKTEILQDCKFVPLKGSLGWK